MLYLVLLLTLQVAPDLHEQFFDLETRVVSGLHDQDASRLENLLADGYILRGRPDVDRETWIRNAVTLCWGERSDIEEFSVQEAGGAVVTSYVLTLYQDPVTCRPAIIRSLITDIWTGQDGAWRLAVRHSGPIGEAGQDALAQQFRLDELPPPRWEGTSELSFVSTGGNADIQTLGTRAQLVFRPGVWETVASGSFVRSTAGGAESARSLSLQLRQSARLSRRMDVFARSGYGRDLFAGIDHRVTVDSGVGYRLHNTSRHGLKIDVGMGYLSEDRTLGSNLESATASIVKNWRWRIASPITVTNDAVATMPFERSDAWRVTNQFSLTTALTDMFSVKFSYTANHLNQPVPGFGRTDTIFSTALVARFDRR